jgi:hypothetical protein
VPAVTPGVESCDSVMDANSRSGLVGIRLTTKDLKDPEPDYITAKVSYTEILAPP